MGIINIAVFVSGSGSNCENIIKYFMDSNRIHVALVVSSKPDAFALQRASRLGVDSVVVTKDQLKQEQFVMEILDKYMIQWVILAGFLPLIPDYLIEAYPRRILNIHPSLLPKYGGKGMWGHHVHEAVKAAKEKETGITIHYVTPICDSGEIIAQYHVTLSEEDTAEDIENKVHELEMFYFPKVIEQEIAK